MSQPSAGIFPICVSGCLQQKKTVNPEQHSLTPSFRSSSRNTVHGSCLNTSPNAISPTSKPNSTARNASPQPNPDRPLKFAAQDNFVFCRGGLTPSLFV